LGRVEGDAFSGVLPDSGKKCFVAEKIRKKWLFCNGCLLVKMTFFVKID
jgi:hypothetical protein